ncbi:MAG: hotdog fold thioesterase [Bacteroidetes bacterium]|nr:hotdog fold thioesterase [Bacteroidota bacterium]
MNHGNIGETLNITFEEMGDDFITASMPVDARTIQPFGILHGGASVVLAETLGSVASWLCVDRDHFIGVGLEINANHIKAVNAGRVTGICKPLHIGGKTHVWDIKIYNQQNELSCVSRFTCAIIAKNKLPLSK